MRVAVLGAGVVGVATAFYLAQAGCEVVLIDAADGPGDGATCGNAGILTAGDSNVWASPSTLGSIPSVLVGRDPSMCVDWSAGTAMIGWGARFVRECTPGHNRKNVAASHRLATLSLRAIRELNDDEGLDFGLRQNGLLVLFDDRTALEKGIEATRVQKEAGEEYEILDRAGVVDVEPAFETSPTPPGLAIYSPNDMSADSLAFVLQLLDRCAALGVETRYACNIESFTEHSAGIAGVETSTGTITADRYVVCLGHSSSRLARSAGDTLHMMPATGFSATANIVDDGRIPEIAVIHEGRHVAFSRTGHQLRLTSSAVVGSSSRSVSDAKLSTIRDATEALFPDALDLANARHGARARPVMARNRPAIGRGTDHSVFYNTGHGALGWTQACGSALLVSALVRGATTPIDPTDFAIH
ncbi:MAG: FAD-dependent oxidoreductase [Actinomycetia bacterium]|nr:FAD-dependent oxidoreductase [Actinomycetes bacterium]